MKKTLFSFLAAAFSGLLFGLLWAPFARYDLLWLAPVPLLLLARALAPRRAGLFGFLAGFIGWSMQLFWLTELSEYGGPWPLVYPGWLALSAVMALFYGFFAYLCGTLRRALLSAPEETAEPYGPRPVFPRPAAMRLLLVLILEPAVWAGLEVLRSNIFTGFGWNPLGLACGRLLPLLQLASVGGAAMVSALIIAGAGAIATIFERCWGAFIRAGRPDRRGRLLLSLESFLPLLLLCAVFLWGADRIRALDAQAAEGRPVALVTERTEVPCVFTGERMPPVWELAEKRRDIITTFIEAGLWNADLWVWPESAVANYAFPDKAPGAAWKLMQLASVTQTPLLVGGLCRTPDRKGWYNAAMLFTDKGLDVPQVYGKRHLVPFGEYIPFDKEIPALQRLAPTGLSCTPGEKVTMQTLPSGLKIGPLICFEDAVDSVARESVRDGAQLLVNMSNDAWYAGTAEPAQHADQARLRCIENGVPMIRSANHGEAVLIDAAGRLRPADMLPVRLTVPHDPMKEPTLWVRCGQLIFGLPCATFVLVLLGWRLFRRLPLRKTQA